MRKAVSFLIVLFVWLSTTGINCRSGPAPLPGERSLSVPYFSQPPESFWCGPASVQMWEGYEWGVASVDTQQFIFNWMVAHYPGEASEFGVSPRAIAGAAGYFVAGGTNYMTAELYGGAAEIKQALADLSKTSTQGIL